MGSDFDSDDVSPDGLERIDVEVERFRRHAVEVRRVALRPYWVGRAPRAPLLDEVERLVCLTALIKEDLRRRFDQGESTSVTAYLADFPELRAASSRVVSLVYEEYCLREDRGEAPDVDSFCDRYAPWRDSLRAQLGYHRILSQAAGVAPSRPRFPKVGERFEEFELLARIGKGGYSRVFLAADRSLGGKRVVLKVALDRGREAEAQGALDHPHIVPVNSVAFPDDGDFLGLSMPYRPGVPLDDVLRRLRADGRRPRSAAEIWNAMAAGVRASGAPISDDLVEALKTGPRGDGWREFPIDGSFERGAAWIGMVLARALAYAHNHRTYHRDVKPGNILLTVQHGPQLLDFNLAQSPHSAEEANSAFQGGTLPYMAPEQIEAFLNPSRWADVTGPADVYSLGLVLRELLTGEPLDAPDGALLTPRALRNLLDRRLCVASEVRRHAPATPHGLEAIIQKCLRYHQEERYTNASELAEDLERFLQRRPLIHAVNPSRAERVRDWAVRNRRLIAANAFYLALLALISPLLIQKASLLLLPDVKEQPELHRAVEAVEAGSYIEAVSILENLTRLYPDSPLLHYYQSFARNGVGESMPSPALFDYLAAMKSPGARAELRAWAASHPKVVDHLNAYANNRLYHYGAEIQKNRELTPAQLAPLLDEVDSAADAFQIALEVSPDSADALQGLATIDEMNGRIENAHERLTTALKTTARMADRTQGWLVVSLRTQRCRVSTARANRALDDDARAHPEVLTMLDEALADLDVADSQGTSDNRALRQACRAEALMARCRLHLQLGKLEAAREDCDNAKSALDRWLMLARDAGHPVEDIDAREYRRRHRELQQQCATSNSSD